MPTAKWQGPTTQLIEASDSPRHGFGDKASIVRTYHGLHSLCVTSALPKGTFGTGTEEGYVVASSEVQRSRGGIGTLIITWDAFSIASGQQLAPDEYGVEPFEVNPALEKHPRYSSLDDAARKKVRDAFRAFGEGSDAHSAGLSSLADELLKKLQRGNENYYLAGLKYSWTQHFWSVVGTINRGGYIEAPGGPLTGLLPGSVQWLRMADTLEFTGQFFRYTRNWLGGPSGHWDTQIYSP